MQTAAFKSFAGNKKYLENISDIVFGSDCYNQLIVTEENFRVDLPQSFKSEKKQFSLSWHQESGYFTNYVSHSKGLVVWIPLFDTSAEAGSLKFFPNLTFWGHWYIPNITQIPSTKKTYVPKLTLKNMDWISIRQ